MKTRIILDLDLSEDEVRRVGRAIGKVPVEVTPGDVQRFLGKKMEQVVQTVFNKQDRKASKDLKDRVFESIQNGQQAGQTRLLGKTDKALMSEFDNEPATSVRWARYALFQDGKIKEGGHRSGGKFWVVV